MSIEYDIQWGIHTIKYIFERLQSANNQLEIIKQKL